MNNQVSDISDNRTLAVITKAEIDQQIATAKQYPRNLADFGKQLPLLSAPNEAAATECMYALVRQEKTIEGPSARFAEVAAYLWGNCRAGARIVGEERDFVTAQGVFHDLEANVAITYEVKRRIVGSNGNRYSADMIGVTANAACSIALRNAILKGIPHSFWKPAYEEVRRLAMGKAGTLEKRREEAVKFFKMLKITEAQICATMKVATLADIDQEKLMILRGIATAIKEGDTTADQAFGLVNEPNESATTTALNETLKKATPPVKDPQAQAKPHKPTKDELLLAVKEAGKKDPDKTADELEDIRKAAIEYLSGDDTAAVNDAISDRYDAMDIGI